MSPALLNSLAIAWTRDSAPYPTCAVGGVPQPLKMARRAGSSPKLGGYCGQGRTYGSRGLHPPDPCGQAPPDTWRPDRRRSSEAVQGGVPNQVVDKGAYTGRSGCAHPTDAPGAAWTSPRTAGRRVRNPKLRTMAQLPLAWAAPRRRLHQAAARTRAKGVALSDPKSAGRRHHGRPGGPGAAPKPVATSMTISGPCGPQGAADALSAVMWWRERSRPAASTPLRACGPARPSGCG